MSVPPLLLLQVVSVEVVSATVDAMVEVTTETEAERTAEVTAEGSSEATTSRAARTLASSSSAVMPLKPSRYDMRPPS
ncbi:hypothetical protein F5883DRAFT_539279 [Diaporthe sp. PMI_573]|nr:hypothetical protein F5883DRAFT_539279 [Diaporthaceae sp. PMI_573]